MIVVAVEYLNTRPFIYGITCAGSSELRNGLLTAIPAHCADAYLSGKADIALVPVGALSESDLDNIITPYCISASSRVETVALLSDSPIDKIDTIYLDSHSRTSVALAQVLAREWWHITPKFVAGIDRGYKVGPNQAIVAIGDKVFDIESRYAVKTDLAEQWQLYTGLPFVFAVWVARTEIGKRAQAELGKALAFGVSNIEKSIAKDRYYARNLSYLTKNIEFEFNASKREAMELFLKKIRK